MTSTGPITGPKPSGLRKYTTVPVRSLTDKTDTVIGIISTMGNIRTGKALKDTLTEKVN